MFDLSMDNNKESTKQRAQDKVDDKTLDSIVDNSTYGLERIGKGGPTDSLSSDLLNDGLKTPSGNTIRVIPMQLDATKIRVSKFNKRDQNNLDVSDLAPLIEKTGTNLVPILVRPVFDDPNYDFEALYGSRRRKACEITGKPVTALSSEVTDEDAIYFATLENMGDKDLSPFEWSEQYQLFINSKTPLYKSIGDLANGLGFRRQHASQIYNLKTVPSELYSRIDKKDMTIRKCVMVKKLWDAIESEEKTAFLKILREEPQLCMQMEEAVKRLSKISPVLLFESQRSEREYGNNGSTIVTKTNASGSRKIEFLINKDLTEEQYKELEGFITTVENGS